MQRVVAEQRGEEATRTFGPKLPQLPPPPPCCAAAGPQLWLSEWLDTLGTGDKFVYTTHSWILSLYLDCPPNMGLACPPPGAVAAVKAGIQRGAITWHAVPFNPQYEMFQPWLLAEAVALTHRLDDQFGLPHKTVASLVRARPACSGPVSCRARSKGRGLGRRSVPVPAGYTLWCGQTTLYACPPLSGRARMSCRPQRDVPGLTRGAVPVLARAGVRAISMGINPGSAPPGTPKNRPFIW